MPQENWDVSPSTEPHIEVWGGAEYTCNRVRDRYLDQTELSGHAGRLHDLELFADLGIEALRCGVLWEQHVRDASWRQADLYLAAVRRANMRPIVGLVHHGSGPEDTNLLDPGFPEKLALYAGKVAARYPWIGAYTPVNEPHTTARFACQYGIWYPHHQSRASCMRALVHQMKAVVLSMRAIREVRSDAELIQTDDLGKFWSTLQLSMTSDLFNERRWLPFDLLCGMVDKLHPLYTYLLSGGISEYEILWFRDNPLAPQVIGINYYVTSDRFLDHRVEMYPEQFRSAEGSFVDLEAVRVRSDGIQGFEEILCSAYERYELPVALTEVHLGDRVDEQIRWAAEAWHSTRRAQQAGVPCRSVTFWALLGSYFWNALVTSDNGHYESGVFDMRDGTPRASELAGIVRQCAYDEFPSHQALSESGWWRRPDRLYQDLPADMVERVAELSDAIPVG